MNPKTLAGIIAATSIASAGLTGAITKQDPPAPPEPIIRFEPVAIGSAKLMVGVIDQGQSLRFEVVLGDGGIKYGVMGLNTP